MSKSKNFLFDGSDEEDEGRIHINKAYASKYEEWRRGEELQKLKDRYGEDYETSSDSESSDKEFVEPDNPEFDRDFLLTLGALHKKEVKPDEKFFPGNYKKKPQDEDQEKEKDKAMTIMDYQRYIMIERDGQLDEDEEDFTNNKNAGEEQSKDRKITIIDDGVSSDDDGGDGLLTSGLFKVKEKDSENTVPKPEKVVDDAVAFVKGESSSMSNNNDKNLLEGVKQAWNDPKISKADKWLADFFLNKRYLDDEDESIEREYNEVIIDEETLSEDEKTVEAMEVFETKYRFRYEEPDQEFIKRYPRIINDSVRTKDERRKEHREALKQRKAQEKEQKRHEIQKLKALKYKEIQDKIEKIKEASGNDDIDFGDNDLEGDFDPDAHESAMSRMFGNDYYADDDGNTQKPVFDDDDIIKDYDDWLMKGGLDSSGGDGAGIIHEENDDDYEEWGENEHFNMDADYDEYSQSRKELQEMMTKASGKKCRRKSKFAKALSQKKPVFDPKERNFDSYFDEYYQLNFEDVVGGIPCRFKYRNVESNSFGLSTEEILSAQDKELNKWFSLKKMLKYYRSHDEEQQDRNMYTQRASNSTVKQKILSSLFTEDPQEQQIIEQEKKRIKNLKKKLRRQQRQEDIQEDLDNHPSLTHGEKHEILHTGESIKRPLDTGNEEEPTKKKNKYLQIEVDGQENENLLCNITNTADSEFDETPKKKKEKTSVDTGESALIEGTTTSNVSIIQNSKGVSNIGTGGSKDNEISKLDSSTTSKKRKKKKKKKSPGTTTATALTKVAKKRKMKNKTQNTIFKGISDARLEAYGANPKRLKRQVKYGKKKDF